MAKMHKEEERKNLANKFDAQGRSLLSLEEERQTEKRTDHGHGDNRNRHHESAKASASIMSVYKYTRGGSQTMFTGFRPFLTHPPC